MMVSSVSTVDGFAVLLCKSAVLLQFVVHCFYEYGGGLFVIGAYSAESDWWHQVDGVPEQFLGVKVHDYGAVIAVCDVVERAVAYRFNAVDESG